jgi:hypothetical protein
MPEEPRPDPELDETEPADDAPEPEGPPPTRIPEPEPEASQRKRFIVRGPDDAPLVVTVADGPVTKRYAPAELVAKLTTHVALLLREMGGGFAPMLYAAAPGRSIRLYFGDPDPLEDQERLAVEFTAVYAERVADLIDAEGDQFFRRALLIGTPMKHYNDLTQVVTSEGVTLTWAVLGQPPRVLPPDRAERQHERLSAPPETVDRSLVVNGVLYRVITESTREGFLGSVGIHLHSWSAKLPNDPKRRRLIARYEKRDVAETIKRGLVGEPVRAHLLLRTPAPGSSIDPNRVDLILDDLEEGPPEDSRVSFFDEDAEWEET